jgi:hypothetical protein
MTWGFNAAAVGHAGLRERAIGLTGREPLLIEALPREPSRQSVADRLAEIAALERAGEIAEKGVAVVVDGIGVRERQHAAARRGAGEIENSRHGFFPVVRDHAAGHARDGAPRRQGRRGLR